MLIEISYFRLNAVFASLLAPGLSFTALSLINGQASFQQNIDCKYKIKMKLLFNPKTDAGAVRDKLHENWIKLNIKKIYFF